MFSCSWRKFIATLIKLRLRNETADKQKLIDYLLKNAFK